MKIKWLLSFETGVASIDNDHRTLVEVIQKIENALTVGDLKICSGLFSEFMKLAADHFDREENMLRTIDFPRVESHRAAHKRLLDMGTETLKKVDSGLDQDGTAKCLEEMIYFLLEDVIKVDAEFKSYAQEKGLI